MAAARNSDDETIVALATPVGNAALAVVRASGPLAAVLAAEGPLGARRLSPRRVEHRDYHALDGRLVDDVVAVHFPAPRSYTGEDVLEISTHGNPFLVQRVIDDLCARGCRPARPGEFTQRAFLSGRMDLSQAEAVMDVIRARSDRSLELAQRQLRGEMGRRLAPLEAGLLQALAEVEAYIDFPEEDLPAEDRRRVVGRLEAVQAGVRELLATRRVGEWVREGIRTVIVGRPNAGKSSLLNRLVGYERALVSPEPGTTRDFLEEWVRVGPHVLRLVDTAGLNPLAKNELEERGIALGERRAADADRFGGPGERDAWSAACRGRSCCGSGRGRLAHGDGFGGQWCGIGLVKSSD
jgi:tRNA modification GTPase